MRAQQQCTVFGGKALKGGLYASAMGCCGTLRLHQVSPSAADRGLFALLIDDLTCAQHKARLTTTPLE